MQQKKIELVYDEQCPLCRTYCKNIKADNDVNLSIIDARKTPPILERINKEGYDIDTGMVANIDGTLYYGSDAIHRIANISQKQGPFAWMNKLFFNTPKKSKIFYPVAQVFRDVFLRLFNIDDIHNLRPKNILKNQLGKCWDRLHPNIQKRFAHNLKDDETIIYEGEMLEMRRSFMGWLFAKLTQPIGNPLSSHQGTHVKMEVTLFKKPNRLGTFWQRKYELPNRKPYVVVSSKQENKQGEMMECVGGGFGMKLHVYEEDGSLHFKSYQYFWKFMKFHIPIPEWLSPGATHVIHSDLDDDRFTYTIKMHHKQLGETFYQHGVFQQREA